MRKHGGIWLALLLALLAAAVLAPVAAMAEEPEEIPIDAEHFPDARFQAYVKDFDKDDDSSLSPEEIADVKEINVSSRYISDLTGIEHFTALEELNCSSNQLTELDVSKNTKLTYLSCELNEEMTRLDVSGCAALKELYCFRNPLTTLDVSDCAALETLNCSYNQLTELDVSYCTALGTLDCSDNQLTELDVLRHTELGSLVCSNNQLTTLDVSDCAALETLNCSNNQLASLDVSGCMALETLDCSDQTARLGVNRSADGTWSANLAALVTGWKDKAENITKAPAEVWGETNDTAIWSKGTVRPTVTYDYDTGYVKNTVHVKMDVTLTLVPLGVGTEADVTRATVKSSVGVISGTEITVKLPAGSPLPTEKDIAVTLSPTPP